jgi:hypothetical protein
MRVRRHLVLGFGALGAAVVFASQPGQAVDMRYDCGHVPPARAHNKDYPQGADVLSCTRPDARTEAWTIKGPFVSQRLTEYPAIKFEPGDVVTIHADGCVQSGGHGDTWKQYVVPLTGGGDHDNMYYATLSIDGVNPVGVPQRLAHFVDTPIVIPRAAHLRLGYVDDGYGDNGYYSHDNGVRDQCKNVGEVTVTVRIEHGRSPFGACVGPQAGGGSGAEAPEIAKVEQLLKKDAQVDLGAPASADASNATLKHFQQFRTAAGAHGSVEMHADGCVYVAQSPDKAPRFYPIDYAFDKDSAQKHAARPWELSPPTYGDLQTKNRDQATWASALLRGDCGGAAAPGRTSAPRWMKMCTPKTTPVAQWTDRALTGFPTAREASVTQSGRFCKWKKFDEPSLTDSCISFEGGEWRAASIDADGGHKIASGVITNSFLSGGDFARDHNDKPGGQWLGVHVDGDMHNAGVNGCGHLTVYDGDHCADWELNLLPDPNDRYLLARDEHTLNDHMPRDCASRSKFRHGNFVDDLKGALSVELEQWMMPAGYRPEPGDRATISGRYAVDCGHENWQTELHPPDFVESSFLQDGPLVPSFGMTRNVPTALVRLWDTHRSPATITKVVITPYWAGNDLEFDVWPPVRPGVDARLEWRRESAPNARAIQGIESFRRRRRRQRTRTTFTCACIEPARIGRRTPAGTATSTIRAAISTSRRRSRFGGGRAEIDVRLGARSRRP